MPKYRDNQISDTRMNNFYEFPNYRLHGNTIIDKSDESATLLKETPHFEAKNYGKAHYTGVTWYNEINKNPLNALNITRRYNDFSNNFEMGRFAYMTNGYTPLSYVQISNDPKYYTKSYVLDSEDSRYCYFMYTPNDYLFARALVKYDLIENKIIWSNDFNGEDLIPRDEYQSTSSYGIPRLTPFYQDADSIYFIIMAMSNVYYPRDYYYHYYDYWGSHITSLYGNLYSLGTGIIGFNKKTGRAISKPIYTSNIDADKNDVNVTHINSEYANHIASLGAANSLIYVKELSKFRHLFFNLTYVNKNCLSYSTDTRFGTSSYSDNGIQYYQYLASYIVFDIAQNKFIIPDDVVHSPLNYEEWIDHIDYNKYYSVISHKYRDDAATSTLKNWLTVLSYMIGYSLRFDHATTPDPDYKDTPTIYAIFYNTYNLAAELSHEYPDLPWVRYKHVWKFVYENGKQHAKELKMLNKDNKEMMYDDWIPEGITFEEASGNANKGDNNYLRTSYPYIIHKDGKKYLLIVEKLVMTNAINHMHTSTVPNNFYYQWLNLFEFDKNNDNTLIHRDKTKKLFTDLMFDREDRMILLNDKLIEYVTIKDDKLVTVRSIHPEKDTNDFHFAAMDDQDKLWYYEAIARDNDSNYYSNLVLHYIDDLEVGRIVINKDKDVFKYEGIDINSNIYLSVYDVNGTTLLEKSITITINGNAVFAENNEKTLEIESSAQKSVKIPIIIKGPGEIVYEAKIA